MRLLSPAGPTLEPRHLDFRELCDSKYPGRKWHSLKIGEQLDLIRESITSKHWLLDPDTMYMQYWECVVLLALVYAAFVAPFEVAFLSGSLGSFVPWTYNSS